ncbi:MAG: ROK family protein [Lachnospiraceae bacterium]|nr:ROK family protein [Lachnospiraceae bacterium]
MDHSPELLAALETGGTKMIGAVFTEDGKMLSDITVPTGMPEDTMPALLSFFSKYTISAIGVSSFGPLQLTKGSPEYGTITSTPKPGWKNYPLGRTLGDTLHAPFAVETDVGGALIAEINEGAGRGCDTCVYATIGTGIGSAFIDRGKLTGTLRHATMGHIIVKPHPRDPFPDGFCSFHKGCLEGLASGKSMQTRWGMTVRDLPGSHISWEIESYYLAQFCVSLILGYMPERIILGGGVMKHPDLLPMIRQKVQVMLGEYLNLPEVHDDIDRYIVRAELEGKNGILGAFYIAKQILNKRGVYNE